jgi:endonuclease/exonuclease/phosphatase family metal-dependent hydrolase
MKHSAVAFFIIFFLILVSFTKAFAGPPDTITVLTFNVYDPFFGPNRTERIKALPEAVMALEPLPDVMVFEEFFKEGHREMFVADLRELGYPVETAHYLKKHYGTGVLVISRFPLESFEFTPFRVDGAIYDVERYVGKGVHHYILQTPHGPLELFATHPIARWKPLYDEEGAHLDRDRVTIDRLLEIERIARVIAAQADPGARSIVLAGDLNASPDMWSYQYLIARTGFEDSYYAVHPGQYASTYSPESTMVNTDWSRIDHVLFKNLPGKRGFWLKPVSSEVVLKQKIKLESGEETSFSDHFGVLSSFEVMEKPGAVRMSAGYRPEKSVGRRSRSDLAGRGIMLTEENHLDWQAWAVETMDKAERRYNRFSVKAIPAARTVIAGDVKEPVVVPLSPLQRSAVIMDLTISE